MSTEDNVRRIHAWTAEQVESAQTPNYGKLFVTAPNLLQMMGDVEGRAVLELGCGSGFWLRLLQRMGAGRCHGIDNAPQQIQAAMDSSAKAADSTYEVGDITVPLDLHPDYDIVFLEHVLLEITSLEGLRAVFRNARRALRPGGTLVVSDMHPFAPDSRPANMRVPEDYNYFSDGTGFEIASRRIDGNVTYYKDCHWSLGALAGAITEAGFAITTIREPLPSAEDVARYPEQLAYRLTTPMALMLRCQPLGTEPEY